jgi:hypothetical protein
MIIDIRKDLPDFDAYLRQRIAAHMETAGSEPVSRVQFGFEFGQANYVVLVLDTRPDAEPDGEWTMAIDDMIDAKTALLRPHWPIWHKLPDDEHVSFIDISSKEVDVMEDTDNRVCTIVGEALRHVLLQARANGVFTRLSKNPKCELAVENIEGYYGWPPYEDRGKENLA